VDVSGLVSDVCLMAVQDNPGDVTLDVNAEATRKLRAVTPELRAVIQALVVNAMEASPPGSSLHIGVEDLADEVQVSIRDHGPGLPQEVRERLFTPHVTTKAQGSGMGLFLAKRIVTSKYGGDLCLSDVPGGGTLAVVSLPGEGRIRWES